MSRSRFGRSTARAVFRSFFPAGSLARAQGLYTGLYEAVDDKISADAAAEEAAEAAALEAAKKARDAVIFGAGGGVMLGLAGWRSRGGGGALPRWLGGGADDGAALRLYGLALLGAFETREALEHLWKGNLPYLKVFV